ncbi:MAG: hypothetical protein AAF614_03555 [Chloroflexota bacterium]
MTNHTFNLRQQTFPLLTLLHPRKQLGLITAVFLASVVLGWWGVTQWEWQLWMAAAAVMGLTILPLAFKWRDDLQTYGQIGLGLSFLLTAQGFHTLEHLAQWAQYHIFDWDVRDANGLLSPANSEWVHFTWNWLVVLAVLWLVKLGWRNGWAWALVIWAVAHASEHTYMFVRYLEVLNQLEALGASHITAQGLPGILGQGGWLAQSEVTRNTILCRLPVLTTAVRLDVHFWWNAGEMILLLFAGHYHLKNAPMRDSS